MQPVTHPRIRISQANQSKVQLTTPDFGQMAPPSTDKREPEAFAAYGNPLAMSTALVRQPDGTFAPVNKQLSELYVNPLKPTDARNVEKLQQGVSGNPWWQLCEGSSQLGSTFPLLTTNQNESPVMQNNQMPPAPQQSQQSWPQPTQQPQAQQPPAYPQPYQQPGPTAPGYVGGGYSQPQPPYYGQAIPVPQPAAPQMPFNVPAETPAPSVPTHPVQLQVNGLAFTLQAYDIMRLPDAVVLVTPTDLGVSLQSLPRGASVVIGSDSAGGMALTATGLAFSTEWHPTLNATYIVFVVPEQPSGT